MRLAGRGQPHLDSDRACAHNKKPLTSTEGEWPIAMGYIGDVRASWRRRRSACKRWINSIISLCRGESDSSVTDQVPVTMQFRGGQQWRKNKKTGWGEGGQWEIKWPRCSGPEPQSLQVGSETLWRNLKISDSRPWQFTSSRILDLPSLHSSSLPPRFFLVFCWSLLCKYYKIYAKINLHKLFHQFLWWSQYLWSNKWREKLSLLWDQTLLRYQGMQWLEIHLCNMWGYIVECRPGSNC